MFHRALSLTVVLVMVAGCSPTETATQPETAAPPAVETDLAAEPIAAAKSPLHIDIRNARTPFEGILTGGQPTVEQLEDMARAGYSTVVNLRPPGENSEWDEASKAAELGLRYVNIEVAGADGLTAENAAKLAEIVDDPESRPLLVHCASGNRVGALFALKAFHIDGEDAASAVQAGLNAGLTSLEDAVKERLSQ